ncbi:hypothetical protein, partial [Methylomonas rivi]
MPDASAAGNIATLAFNRPRHFSQASKEHAHNTTQTATPAANGSKLPKKPEPENELAEDPKISMVPNKAHIARADHSTLNNSRFPRLQNAGDGRRLRAADFRGFLATAAGDFS